MVGDSSKRQYILKDIQQKVMEALIKGKLVSGCGLNQETNLQRPCDTHLSSHYNTLVRLIGMFSSVIEVLDLIMDDPEQRVDANMFLNALQSFEFAFPVHLMKKVLAITTELSLALQKKRAREIVVPNMNEKYVSPRRSKRRTEEKTNDTYFRIECFYGVLDKQLTELNSRFSVKNAELLLFVGGLNPSNSLLPFNKENLVKFARLYPREFSSHDLELLDNQLETYIIDMRSSIEFLEVVGIGDLAKKTVETKRHGIYHLVYMLLTLALTLPVATASVERAFSAMSIIKDQLRNRISED